MKKIAYIIPLLIVGLLVFPFPVQAAISRVQHNSYASVFGTSTTYNATITATGTGNLILVGFFGVFTNLSTITDNAGNTYTSLLHNNSASTDYEDIWYAKNSIAGATTVTITVPFTISESDIEISEYSGADTVSPVDGTPPSSFGSSTGPGHLLTGAADTTGNANDLLFTVGWARAQSITGIHAGNGFSSIDITASNGNQVGFAQDIVSSTGTYNAAWDTTDWNDSYSSIAAFKAGTAGGAAGPTTPVHKFVFNGQNKVLFIGKK